MPQFMEIRKFSVTEVARIFGIPPHKLGDLERATFSNIEEQNIDYVIRTLRRWLVRWEQECNRKLIAPLEKSAAVHASISWTASSAGTSRAGTARTARGSTTGSCRPMTSGGSRISIPIEGGDTYLVQGAMVPLDRLDELVDKQVRPPPAPVVP